MSTITNYVIGDTIPVSLLYQVNGEAVPDLTSLTFQIFLDSTEIIASTSLVESSSIPGLYEYSWDTTGLSLGGYTVYFYEESKFLGFDQYDLSKYKQEIVDGVWDEDVDSHIAINTFGKKLQDIRVDTQYLIDIESGNWSVQNNQMIFYNRLGAELFRFNLFNAFNDRSSESVYKRERV